MMTESAEKPSERPCGRALLPVAHEPHDYWTDEVAPRAAHCPGHPRTTAATRAGRQAPQAQGGGA